MPIGIPPIGPLGGSSSSDSKTGNSTTNTSSTSGDDSSGGIIDTTTDVLADAGEAVSRTGTAIDKAVPNIHPSDVPQAGSAIDYHVPNISPGEVYDVATSDPGNARTGGPGEAFGDGGLLNTKEERRLQQDINAVQDAIVSDEKANTPAEKIGKGIANGIAGVAEAPLTVEEGVETVEHGIEQTTENDLDTAVKQSAPILISRGQQTARSIAKHPYQSLGQIGAGLALGAAGRPPTSLSRIATPDVDSGSVRRFIDDERGQGQVPDLKTPDTDTDTYTDTDQRQKPTGDPVTEDMTEIPIKDESDVPGGRNIPIQDQTKPRDVDVDIPRHRENLADLPRPGDLRPALGPLSIGGKQDEAQQSRVRQRDRERTRDRQRDRTDTVVTPDVRERVDVGVTERVRNREDVTPDNDNRNQSHTDSQPRPDPDPNRRRRQEPGNGFEPQPDEEKEEKKQPFAVKYRNPIAGPFGIL